ncbi:extensin [Streptomyces sp. NPDC002499]
MAVQRAPWSRSKSPSPAKHQTTRHSATGALASAAAATVASTLGRHAPAAPPAAARRHEPPPPYTATTSGPPPNQPPPPYSASASAAAPPPEYTAVAAGGFDPRDLTDFQLDELVHRIIGRITRLIRTELRMDRERIGKLRDPRH